MGWFHHLKKHKPEIEILAINTLISTLYQYKLIEKRHVISKFYNSLMSVLMRRIKGKCNKAMDEASYEQIMSKLTELVCFGAK